jgi:citronellol/citronellal dehydrogenase
MLDVESARKNPFRPGLFDGKVAIVTGGGSGIGLVTARELLELGARVAICGRNLDKLKEAERELCKHGEVLSGGCDIREPEQVEAFVSAVMARFSRIDVLVNNAGGQFPSPAMAMSPKGWNAVIRNNLNGTFYMTREVATRAMIPASSGAIVNVTANVDRGFPGFSHTGAARAGVENMTRSLAIEWAQFDVRVNAVAPGNNIKSSGTAQYGEMAIEIARQQTPQKRTGTVEEIAHAIVFLACPAAAFITGCVFHIDGGQALWGSTWPIPDR